MDKKFKKILVINIAPIGDVIMSSAAVRMLRQRYPDAYITFRIPPACSGLLSDPEIIDRIDVDRPPKGGFFLSLYRSWQAWKYRREGYDACFFFEESPGFAKRLTSIPYRVGPSHRPAGHENALARYCSRSVDTSNCQLHMVDFYKKIVAQDAAGDSSPWLCALPEAQPAADGKAAVAFCFEVSGRNRHRWPKEYALALLRMLAAKGYLLFSYVAPGEGMKTRELVEAADVKATVVEGSLFESAQKLQAMNLLVSMDSGQVHLAAALGVPVLSLAGLTPKTTYPYTEKGVAISASGGCDDCPFFTGCESNKVNKAAVTVDYSPPCMRALTPEIVMRYVERMLENPIFSETYIRVGRQPV